MNLLSETLAKMEAYGKKFTDVREVQWIVLSKDTDCTDGTYEHGVEYKRCTWDTFSKAAAKIDYDYDYGIHEIEDSLIVLFNDGNWLERWEYDGSEGWEYRKPGLPMQDECKWEEDVEEIRKQFLMWDQEMDENKIIVTT